MQRASVRDYPDYYLGWVIQPLNWEGTEFYVYPPDDVYRQRGFNIKGSRQEAMSFIEARSKFS